MRRVRFKKTLPSSQTNGEELTENSDPKKYKRNNSRRLKENSTARLCKDNLNPSTSKDNSRYVLSDKTNSTLNEIGPPIKNILTENCANSLRNENKCIRPRNNVNSNNKSLTLRATESTHTENLKKYAVVNTEISDYASSNKRNKHVVPIYKQNKNLSPLLQTVRESLPVEKKLALYEFDEIDTEDPSGVKKKRKKRNYTRKKNYKMGPKYLTINNIKFSSSESINSSTDKPPYRKPCKPVSNKPKKEIAVKRQSQSMINLNDTTNTCVSVASYMSQPLLQTSCSDNDNFNLTVINENEHSGVSQVDEALSTNSFTNFHIQNTNSPSCTIDHQNVPNLNNVNNTYHLEEVYQSNSEDIHSSTPCRVKPPTSHKSIGRSFADIYSNIRPSVSFFERVEDVSSGDEFRGFGEIDCDSEQFKNDCNFGFDDNDEGIEEPLVSPIKKVGDKCVFLPNVMDSRPELPPVLSVREIVQLLQAEQSKEETTNIVIEESTLPEEITEAVETTTDETVGPSSFTKPPRKSYERRLIHRYCFVEKEFESSEDEAYTVKESKPHPKRKPKIKGKKKEAEANKLAEILNSKFQEVDKFSLCVE